jgi:hypothetical protein
MKKSYHIKKHRLGEACFYAVLEYDFNKKEVIARCVKEFKADAIVYCSQMCKSLEITEFEIKFDEKEFEK